MTESFIMSSLLEVSKAQTPQHCSTAVEFLWGLAGARIDEGLSVSPGDDGDM